MKRVWKIFFFIIVIFSFAAEIQAGDIYSFRKFQEDWWSLDFGYGFFIPSPIYPEASTKNFITAFNVNLSRFWFVDWSRFGGFINTYAFFSNDVIAASDVMASANNIYSTEEKAQFIFGFFPGLAWRSKLSSDLILRLGLGIYLEYVGGTYYAHFHGVGISPYEIHGFDAGVGIETALKIALGYDVFINIGVTGMFDIFSSTFVNLPDVYTKYSWFIVKPFIGFGFNLMSEKSGYIGFGMADE